MDLLKKRILEEGRVHGDGVLKVDSFLNHQIDPVLMKAIGEEFVRRFSDVSVDKIVTIEASGIAPALMVGYLLQVPVVFVKKAVPRTMDGMLTSKVYSFTKGVFYDVCVSTNFLKPNDRVLFIDDFLALGNAAVGVKELIDKAGALLMGMGFVIEKSFQEGAGKLQKLDVRVESLAKVKSLNDGIVEFG